MSDWFEQVPLTAAVCLVTQSTQESRVTRQPLAAVPVVEKILNITAAEFGFVDTGHVGLAGVEVVRAGCQLNCNSRSHDKAEDAGQHSPRSEWFEVGEVHLSLQTMQTVSDLSAPLAYPCLWKDKINGDEGDAGDVFKDCHSSHLALALALGCPFVLLNPANELAGR